MTAALCRHGPTPVESLARLVGSTPLVRLRRIGAELPGLRLYVTCEFMNPGGSVKDRPALRMIETALADGRFGKGKTLVDSTSGNTGVAYAWICAALGLRCALVMPANVSAARKRIALAFGAVILLWVERSLWTSIRRLGRFSDGLVLAGIHLNRVRPR